MRDLDAEHRELLRAENLIAVTEMRVTYQLLRMARIEGSSEYPDEAISHLRLLEDALAAFYRHRLIILGCIDRAS